MAVSAHQILVTGGAGRLGQALKARGCHALERSQLDITDPDALAKQLDAVLPSLVINAAAYTAVDQAESDPEAAYHVNGDAVCLIADECASRQIPLIHVSTDCVFGDHRPDLPVAETEEPAPLSVYGFSKRLGEWHAVNEDNLIVRVSWLFDESPDTFIGKILGAAMTRDALSMVDDEWGRPTPVGDLADHLLKLADAKLSDTPLPQILHMGSPEPVSRLGWAKQVFDVSEALGGPNPRLDPVSGDAFPTAARRPRGLILDTSSYEEVIGPMPAWQETSARAVKALLANEV